MIVSVCKKEGDTATNMIWGNTEEKPAEILREYLPACELLAWESETSFRSAAANHQRHPDIPSNKHKTKEL